MIRSLPGGFLAAVLTVLLSGGAQARLMADDGTREVCRIAVPSDVGDDTCGWTFETITRVRTPTATPTEEMENFGRLARIGFTISDLTLEESITAVASGRTAPLSWDREIGIADQLSDAMNVPVDTGTLGSALFLLMPATFNEAYLSDFVDFVACATAHTFIFSGALDGRSDAPYVTHRWLEMRPHVCLDIAGADCSKKGSRIDPARLYFRNDWPCRYSPRRVEDERD